MLFALPVAGNHMGRIRVLLMLVFQCKLEECVFSKTLQCHCVQKAYKCVKTFTVAEEFLDLHVYDAFFENPPICMQTGSKKTCGRHGVSKTGLVLGGKKDLIVTCNTRRLYVNPFFLANGLRKSFVHLVQHHFFVACAIVVLSFMNHFWLSRREFRHVALFCRW